jgi:hypothetical protein
VSRERKCTPEAKKGMEERGMERVGKKRLTNFP